MEARQEYEQRMARELEAMAAALGALAGRGRPAPAEREVERAATVARDHMREAEDRLHTLEASSDQAWEQFQVGFEIAWRRLRQAARDLETRLGARGSAP